MTRRQGGQRQWIEDKRLLKARYAKAKSDVALDVAIEDETVLVRRWCRLGWVGMSGFDLGGGLSFVGVLVVVPSS